MLTFFQKDKTPREGQTIVASLLEQKILEGYKNIILELPTGFGKSPMAYMILKYFRDGFIVTSTKSLQEQYKVEYPEFFDVRGKNNFHCNLKNEQRIKGFECQPCEDFGNDNFDNCLHKFASSAPCITEPEFRDQYKRNICPYHVGNDDYNVTEIEDTINGRGLIQSITLTSQKKQQMISDRLTGINGLDFQKDLSERKKRLILEDIKPCHYFDQKAKAMLADFSIMNYANYILYTHMQMLPSRRVTIFDEAHDIEDQVIEFTHLSFDLDKIKNLLYQIGEDPNSVQIPDTFDIMLHVPLMEKMQEFLESFVSMKTKDDRIKKLQREAQETQERIKRVLDFITLDVNNWKVIELVRNKHTNIIERAVYKPINLSYFCKLIYRNSDYNIFMSASILDRKMFCENHGLDPELTAYISMPSDFPPENRLIHRLDVVELDRFTIKDPEVQKLITQKIDELMDKHKNEKGIIHTKSYEQCDFILKYISTRNKVRLRETDPKKGFDKIQVVDEHRIDPAPTVLISPALSTGIDLKYDDSRFQIIVKVPYPDKSDKWIVAKMNENKNWYTYKTALWLVQAYGRSIRAKDDYAVTYILDAKFSTQFMTDIRAVHILPRWFKDAIIRKK